MVKTASWTSAASDEVQEAVLVDVKPDLNYLFDLFHIQVITLKRLVILLQLFLVATVLCVTWVLARFINQWLKTFSK